MSAKHVQTKNEVQSGLRALFPCFIAKIYKKQQQKRKKKKKEKKKKNGDLLGGPLFKNYWITGVRPVKIKIPLSRHK